MECAAHSRSRRRGSLASLALALSACALDVQTIRYPEAADAAPRAVDCKVRLLEWHRPPHQECRELGDVYVGDPGLAFFHCGRERAEEAIRAEACQLGADTALVRRVKDFYTSCYQARARLLRCGTPDEQGS